MTPSLPDEPLAVRIHSEQSEDFARRYLALGSNPFQSCFAYSRHRLHARLAATLTAVPPGTALDVGCGTGHQLAWLRDQGWQVSGADGSWDMLLHARANNPGALLSRTDVEALPFRSTFFDLVLCIEVVRYLPRWNAILQEMARVLKPGGLLLLTAAPRFNANGYWAINRAALALPLRSLVRLEQFFTTGPGLRRALRRAGFEAIEVHGIYTGPLNWVERLAPRMLPGVLRAWEPLDQRLADLGPLRELSNMFLATAVRRA